MQKTANYNLNKPEVTDPLRLADINQNSDLIDAAIKAVADGVSSAGNCRAVTGSYVGTGAYGSANPNTIPYDKKPLFIMMNVGQYNAYNDIPKVYFFFRDVPKATSQGDNASLTLTWNDDHVSWYFGSNSNYAARCQFNESGTTYQYIIFYT